MSSSNPRYANFKARERVLQIVRSRAAAGEPCGICGKPIDLTAQQTYIDPKDGRRKRAPWALECDEIVPVRLGGSPIDPENVQPAHRACNIRKGGKRKASVKSYVAETSREW